MSLNTTQTDEGEQGPKGEINKKQKMKKKKIRRGQPIKNKLQKFVVLYLNIRKIKPKMDSLVNIIEEVQPSVVCITETHLIDEDKLEIDGYEIRRNNRNNDGGGILIAVHEKISHLMIEVEKKKEIEESLWVTIDNKQTQLRIGVIYTPQESRTSAEQYRTMYESITEQVSAAKQRKEKLLLLGDFNCKIGETIKGNKKEISKSGPNFLKMIRDNKLCVLNTMEKCKGVWTRAEGQCRSVLDYIVIDEDQEQAVKKITIDEEREFAPVGYNMEKEEIQTSDHNTMIATFDWLMEEKEKKQNARKILTKKGYRNFQADMQKEKPSDIWKEGKPFQEAYDEWKDKVTSIINKNETTVKTSKTRKATKHLVKDKKNLKKQAKQANKEERFTIVARIKAIEEQIKEEDHKQFQDKINQVVEKLKGKKGINIPNMWEVVKKIKGRKDEPPTAIKAKNGEVLEDAEKIKDRYLEHFSEILKNVEAETQEEKDQEELIEHAFKRILDVAEEKRTVLTTNAELKKAIKTLKRKKCKDKTGWNNEVILEGGEEMEKSLLAMFNKMEEERTIPQQWQEMKVKTISKPGTVLEMDNKRGLFITDIISKIYEKILKNRNQEKVFNYTSDYQTGGTKNRTTLDNVIVFSEIIRRKRKQGKKCYALFGDAVKCFDKLWLKDALVELYKAGCSIQDIQMIFKMNSNTILEVETPLGATKKMAVGEIVKQGTVLGPTLCCIVTDQINNIAEHQERSLGNEYVAILVFVDDVMSAGSPEDTRKAIRNCREMEKMKKFTYGLKKTKYMVVNTGREKEEEINEEVKAGKVTKTDEYKYVGFNVDTKGDCQHHIEKKSSKLPGQIEALKSMASYSNVGSSFVNVRLNMYEMCIIPSFLHALEAWNKITKKEIMTLEQQQAKALCSLLHLPRTTPYLALLNEVGICRIKERLECKKALLLQNILVSDDRRLVKRILEEQKENEEEDTFYMESKKIMQM